jgi:glycosyltransferase involved in cell wall biosynthesis
MKIGFKASRLKKKYNFNSSYDSNVIRGLCQYFPQNQYLYYSSRPNAIEITQQCPALQLAQPSASASRLKLSRLSNLYSVPASIKNFRPEVVHSLESEVLLRKPGRSKWVVTVHDLLFLRYPHLYNLLDVSVNKQKAKYACSKADLIVAVSQQTANDIVEFLGIPEDKIRIVYQGVHPIFKEEYDSYILQRIATKYQLPPDYLLNVGTIETRKNALLLLEALNQIKGKMDLPLVLVGKSTPYKKVLEEYIKKNHLQERVIFLHNVQFEDLPKLYQQSSMFVYPSVFEGFGIPILEALVSKVPVITSLGSCFAEAGGPNSIYINPSDSEELAEAILRVYNNPTMATKMTIDGVAHSMNFEDEKLAKDLMQVYKEVV